MEGFASGAHVPPRPDPSDLDTQLNYANLLADAALRAQVQHAEHVPHDLGVLLMNFLHRCPHLLVLVVVIV